MISMFDGAINFNQNIRVWQTRDNLEDGRPGTTFTNMFKNANAMINTYGPNGQNIASFSSTPTKDFFNQ